MRSAAGRARAVLLVLLATGLAVESWHAYDVVAGLAAPTAAPVAAGLAVQQVLLEIALPWFCMALGFWIALVHPLDRRARLLLFLLASFAAIFGGAYDHWPAPIRAIGVTWDTLLAGLWPVAMLAAGLLFPDPHWVERRAPWAKWLLSAPLVAGALVRTVAGVAAPDHPRLAAGAQALLQPFEFSLRILGLLAVSSFFALLGWRHAEPLAPDARRRLTLLGVGASVALSPSFVLLMLGLVTGRALTDVAPVWLTGLALLMMGVFPLTLAYVVVVERALDVRVFIRAGLQYAFARRGIFLLRTGLTVGTAGWAIWRVAQPELRRVEVVGTLATGLLLTVLLKRIGDATLRWTDRRFFREAVDAERVLGQLAEEVRSVVDRDALVDVVERRLRDSLHVERLAVLLPDGAAFGGAPIRLASDSPLVLRLAATREPQRVRPGQDAALDAFGAEVLVPLSAQDHLSGLIVLGPRRAQAPYSPADLRLLASVGDRAGVALDNARLTAAVAAEAAQRGRLAREVEIAREVQQRLFPQAVPRVDGLELAGRCRTALGVGGDYYDFLGLPDGSLLLAIGDVSGKGIGAALVMASLQASLRGQSFQAAGGLTRLVETVNGLVHDATPENRYATLFVGRYEPGTRRLTYVNAGHNAPLLLRAGGGVERLTPTGTVVGLIEHARYAEAVAELRPGDVLCGYSDGVSEAMTVDDEEFGEARLLDALRAAGEGSAGEVIAGVFARADAFAAGAAQHDDMTVVVARARGRGAVARD